MIEFNYTLLIQFVNLLVVLILLNFLLFKPVLKALNKRESTIKDLIFKIEKERENLREMEKRYEELLKERKKPIYDEREKILLATQKEFTEILESAKREVATDVKRAKEEIEKETKVVLEKLSLETERLAKEIARKILLRSVD
ncbi:MAG: ATP synthase F0 subunit B [Desulfobacterota bacterium]|nr:ATP synthase F0 subunit B [Thermodesulfobacteriota bacterium]MDW8001603.1 ATP synthase F0 subunit B [Deltaproteobacteria bacterium]